jgi:putative flippase GtrA
MPNRLTKAAAQLYTTLIRYLLKFGVVGAVGFVIDFTVFNLLLVSGIGNAHLFSGPIGAKVVAVAAATVVTWFGNRYWTFRANRRSNYLAELFEFSVVAVAGLFINVLCLWFSHYVLGFTSLLADNISGTLIGTLLATVFRYVLYRYWVFGHHRKGMVASDDRELTDEEKAEAAADAIFEDDRHAEADATREKPHL